MSLRHDAFISYSHDADGALAPVLERGLERLARSTFQLRAMDVFRDQTSLAASPGVWSGIVEHLSGSRWFIALASPRFSESPWCRKELRWWLDAHGTERLLVVLTDGEIVWDESAGGLDAARTTALPMDEVAGRFTEMPLYVDLRWVRQAATPPGADDPRLRAAWLDLAAPVRGVPKDQLDGDDVRQLRRTRWLARAAVGMIVLGAAVAVWQAVEATRQRHAAVAERERAVSRQLGAQALALRVREPVLALLLAAQAQAVAPTAEAHSALLTLATSLPFERLLERDLPFSSLLARPLPGGGAMLWAGDGAGQVWRLPLPAGNWTRIVEGRGGLMAGRSVMAASPDGRTLAAAGYGDRVTLLAEDATARTVSSDVEREQYLLGLDFSADARWLAVAGQALDRPSGGGFVVLRDLLTGERRTLPDHADAARVRFSPDGRWLAIGGDRGELTLHPLRPGDRAPELSASRAGTVAGFAFTDEGRQLVVAWSYGRIDVLDVATGERRQSVLAIGSGLIEDLAVAADGRVWITTHADGSVWRWWQPRGGSDWTSREIYRHPGPPRGLALLDAGQRVATVDGDGRLMVARDLHLTAPLREAGSALPAALGAGPGPRVTSPDGRWLAQVHAAPLQLGRLVRGVRRATVSLYAQPGQRPVAEAIELDTDANDVSEPSAIFSPDSRLLVVATPARLQFIDLATMRRLEATVPLGEGVQVRGFAEGRWPLWLADDRAKPVLPLTLDVRPEALAAWACAIAGRRLSASEWARTVGPERPYAPACGEGGARP